MISGSEGRNQTLISGTSTDPPQVPLPQPPTLSGHNCALN